MHSKTINKNSVEEEIFNVGFDTRYLSSGVKKHKFLSIKICGLTFVQAAIIKQTALSKGADAAVNKNVLTHAIDNSDLIISGNIQQLENIAKSLKNQQFNLDKVSSLIEKEILLQTKKYTPLIMGILNVTENSFSDGGKYLDVENAINHAKFLIEQGADIIDIGAESTKPHAHMIPVDIEIKRLKPVVKELINNNIKISVDTRNSKTALSMLEIGADIINDVSGFNHDLQMADVVRNSNANIVITHSRGTPETMDDLTCYDNMTDEIFDELQRKIELFNAPDRTIIDVGFGFAKNIEQNFKLLQKIGEFSSLGVKTLAGTSRKRFLKSLVKNTPDFMEELDLLTALSSFYLFENKVDIIRVHDAGKTKSALNFYTALYKT
ncbi:MAG: dihydropteroate synthase [Candidatus Gastranaerophilales bacterium]|nr:dihydropteroate synthase [Candidatus Gastranaerophilales bacterium]